MREVNLQKKIYIILMVFSTNKIQLFQFGFFLLFYVLLVLKPVLICFINNMKKLMELLLRLKAPQRSHHLPAFVLLL